jgi:hypothetical protein
MSEGMNVGIAHELIEPGASHSEDSRKWVIEVAEAIGLSDIAVVREHQASAFNLSVELALLLPTNACSVGRQRKRCRTGDGPPIQRVDIQKASAPRISHYFFRQRAEPWLTALRAV